MNPTVAEKDNKLSKWFDDFVATLRAHELAMETQTASKDVDDFYKNLIGGSSDEIVGMSKVMAQQYFVQKIIYDYISIVKTFIPEKLAFDYNDSEVLVWAEIDNDDLGGEKNLILAEAEINYKYHKYGFDMNTSIVEKSDCLSVPHHYKAFK